MKAKEIRTLQNNQIRKRDKENLQEMLRDTETLTMSIQKLHTTSNWKP